MPLLNRTAVEVRAQRPLTIRLAGNPVPVLWLWTRAATWALALFSLYVFQGSRNPQAWRWDDPRLTRDLGDYTDVWARWDSVWFLRIAAHGYHATASPVRATAAFPPLYPTLMRWLGRWIGHHAVLAGILISLAASLVAFLLLYRLADRHLGADGARRAVLYLAVFPTALFLQAVYSESLYLLLTIAAFLLADRRRFAAAGVAAGLAILTRPVGVALLPALALLAWRDRHRLRALAGLVLALPIAAIYPWLVWRDTGSPWMFAHAEHLWHRHLSPLGPLAGVWNGLRAGWAGIEQVVSGSHKHAYWTAVPDGDPMHVAAVNLGSLAFLLLFIALTFVVWRRFGAPLGLFSALSLAIPLSVPSDGWPLLSISRFGLGIFPFFLALSWIGGRRPRVHTGIVVVSSLLLGVAIVQWALWQWVA